ncbi:SAM-dependent methyltransferase [Nocardioides sp. NPDC000445]|uniref:SAM-dependent methyltransferase n=1 Tax=Nocardioides sp. NPDC000445 TaxID=3154257 RepID=UPI0033338ADB
MRENMDVGRANACRIYDTLIGGGNLSEADRSAYGRLLEINPGTPFVARENRDFMLRACRTLASKYGVRQFLDLGCSFPTLDTPNLHEVIAEHRPEARVLYVDVETEVEQAWEPHIEGLSSVGFIHGNVSDPHGTLEAARAVGVLNFDEPIAIVLTGVLPFVPTDTDPWAAVSAFRDACVDGSHLVLSHALTSEDWPAGAEEVLSMYREQIQPMFPRLERDVLRFFDGYRLLEPGLVSTPAWRPDTPPDPDLVAFKRAVAAVGIKEPCPR